MLPEKVDCGSRTGGDFLIGEVRRTVIERVNKFVLDLLLGRGIEELVVRDDVR